MSPPRHHKFARDMKRYAEYCGVDNVSIGRGRRHPILRGLVNGKAVSVTIPGTPGDRRSLANTLADLRRAVRRARG